MYPGRSPVFIKCSHCKWVFPTENIAEVCAMYMSHMLRAHTEYVKVMYKRATGEDL